MDLKGKKLVLVGGAGLIGSHTVDHLIKEDVKEILKIEFPVILTNWQTLPSGV